MITVGESQHVAVFHNRTESIVANRSLVPA